MSVLDSLLPPVAENKAGTSMVKASTPEPFSASRTSNWVARAGGLPSYIQHIAHDLMEKRGKSESNAIQMAVGIVKNWASGKGNVDANTRAAASKAVAEWEAKKAGSRAKAAVQHADTPVTDALALADSAEVRLFELARVVGLEGLRTLLGGKLEEADGAPKWAPELKRVASASGETSRHEVHDGGQHVGTVTQRPAYSRNEPPRHGAYAVNGREIRDVGLRSQQDAVNAVKRHLEEAPSKVQAHRGGKFLVAEPRSYGGQTTYTEFPNEPAARHAAGLPEKPTSPEQSANAATLAECVACDVALVESFGPKRYEELWGPLLAGGGSGSSVPLAEAFTSALHPHGFHGHFAPTNRAVARMADRVNTSPRLPVRPSSRNADPGRFRGSKLDEKGMVRAVEHGVWTSGAKRVASDLQRGMVKDTETAHRASLPGGKLGSYSPERAQLHAAIIKAMLQGAKSHGTPQAHFMAGGPASGKSHLLKTGKVKLPKDHVAINPDVVKEMLPEYRALKAAGDPNASSAVHEESSHIAKLATNIALHQKMHVVIDTVGNSDPGKFARKIMAAHENGHEVHVHVATVPSDVAVKRSEERAAKTGRHVPEGYLRASHRAVSERFHAEVQHLPVRVNVYDTNGRPRRIAAKTASGPLRVHDSRRYAAFLAKGGIRA